MYNVVLFIMDNCYNKNYVKNKDILFDLEGIVSKQLLLSAI
jgi:hypothetical protein